MTCKEEVREIRLGDQVAKNFHSEYRFRSNFEHIIEVGARASTKSSRNAIRIAEDMLLDPRAEWVIVRQYAKHHADSTIQEMKIAFERLGLIEGYDYKVTKSPQKIKLLHTGQNISFAALEDYSKLKGFKPSSSTKYFAGVLFFEITEFKGEYEMEQAISSFIRGDKEKFRVLYEFNYAKKRSDWTYAFLESKKNNPNYRIIHSTFEDLTKWEQINWLGKNMLSQIQALKIFDKPLYDHIYLGKLLDLGGYIYRRVFKNSDKKINPKVVVMGVDFGWTKSATTMITIVSDYKEIQVYNERGYDDPDRDTVSTINEIELQCRKMMKEIGVSYMQVVPDNADQGMTRSLATRLAMIGVEVVDMGQKIAIEERITVLTHMLSLGVLHVPKEATQLTIAFEDAVRNDKEERLDDGSYPLDYLDGLEYGMFVLWEYFDNLLSWKKAN